ncbi:MAG: Sapep family Mn(2+)-dependent dipeptidase [Clostridia bacterium]|nr:Sapep family Mn(2+)-dependent dipeptidase [Clostridia bacterium]
MEQELKKRVHDYFQANRENIKEGIMTLARIRSVRGESAPGAPFGEGPAAAVRRAVELGAELGFEGEVTPSGYGLVYSGSGARTIGMFAHCDVVPEGDGWIHTQPYEPIEKDGLLIGRGVGDNKNAAVGSLYVMKCIRDLGIPLVSRLLTYMGCDEEVGMEDVEAFAREQPMPDLCLIPDAQFPLGYGEKGILEITFRCDTPFEQIRETFGGMMFNAVAGEAYALIAPDAALQAELERRTAGDERYTVKREGDAIRVEAHGKATHAAMPKDSVNAIKLLAALLTECESLCENDRAIMSTVLQALEDEYGTGMGLAYEDEPSGVMTVACGMTRTEDGCMTLSFNPRYCVTLTGEQLTDNFKRFFEPRGWHMSYCRINEGYYNDKDGPIHTALLKVYQDFTGDRENLPYCSGGGTYARKLKNSISFGLGRPDIPKKMEFPQGHGGAHQPDESMNLDVMLVSLEIYVAALIEVDKLLNK